MVETRRKGMKDSGKVTSIDSRPALALLEQSCEAALATLEEGKPFVSGVGFAYEKANQEKGFGRIYLLLSDLARHTRNIRVCPDVSLLVVEKNMDQSLHERKRLTVLGKVAPIKDTQRFESLKCLVTVA